MNTELKPIMMIDVTKFSLPALTGSEKQIKWATEIRTKKLVSAINAANRHIAELNGVMEVRQSDRIRESCKAFKTAFIPALIEQLRNRDAAHWINLQQTDGFLDTLPMRAGTTAESESLAVTATQNPNMAHNFGIADRFYAKRGN